MNPIHWVNEILQKKKSNEVQCFGLPGTTLSTILKGRNLDTHDK
jgi:hypothetical protein